MRSEARRLVKQLSAPGVPARLALVGELFGGPKCVGELAAAVGTGYDRVSHHLRKLKRVGLLTDEKHGRRVYYRFATRVESNGVLTLAAGWKVRVKGAEPKSCQENGP